MHIKRLHAIAESGLAFSPEPFDQERFEEISHIARQMLADFAQMPIDVITDLIDPIEKRYVTPQVEVRGAIINHGKILLVKEKSDGKWTLPGGYADVGLTPIENVEKEIFEEAGLVASCSRLYALRHKAAGAYRPDIREFYKLYFLCEADPNAVPKAGLETDAAAYFSLTDLPELSRGRTIERDLTDAFEFYMNQFTLARLD